MTNTVEIDLIDTHTHIYYVETEAELDAQIKRCAENGVNRLLLPNVDVDSISAVLKTNARYPEMCFPMMGLHPCSVKEDYVEQLREIEGQLQHEALVAIGEIGLDLYWDKSTLPLQREAFKIQCEWAKSMNRPVSIHCREAYNEIFELLEEIQDGRLRGVLHCFTGNLEQAHRLIDFGLHLGIGGVVTYKNAGLDVVVAQLDPSYIVLETDAPYLAPAPHRGKKNESSFLLHIAKKVADLQEMPVEKLAEITTQNARTIFALS